MAKNKKNTIIKGGEQPKPEKKKKAVKIPPVKGIELSSRKNRLIFGAIFLVFGIYLFIALSSYLFTWSDDQDKLLDTSFSEYVFFGSDIETQNWLGRLGAYTAHLFMYKGFGLSSFLFAVLFANMGANLAFNFKPFKNLFLLKLFLTLGVWLSVCLGYLNIGGSGVFGGSFGTQVSEWLEGVLGKFGTFILLIAALFGNIVVMFDPDWSTLQKWLAKEDNTANDSEEVKSTIIEVDKEGEIIGQENEQHSEEEDDIELTSTIISESEPEIIVEKGAEALVEPISKEVTAEETPITTEPASEENRIEELEITQDEVEVSTPLEADLSESISLDTTVTQSRVETEDEGFSVEVAAEETELSQSEISKVEEFGEYDPTLDLSSYQTPPIDMLEEHGSGNITINKEELELNKNRIVETLEQFKIGISKIKATVGPTVTLYEIIPAPGVRISKIKNLEDDIALSLAALGIRIIAPIPGKGTIGIEVPSSNPSVVSMKSIIASEKFQNNKFELPIVLGKTISNETFTYDLAKMPHLLIAGATGQGKSVGLNAILVSLLYKKHPSQLKFVLVDPKKVELTLYNKIERHFLAKLPDSEDAIITDNSKVINTLNSLCIEMDSRYELLKEAQVRNIKEYNAKFVARKLNPEKGHKFLPYIVLVVDEFADLIMTAGKEVEVPIARLAQLARAIGIHLIIATQRPSVNVITGTIKANFPARIAFRVMQKIDSRTILDATGADQLIGRGDMLISTGNDITRIQCGFVDTPEVEEICDFIGEQRGYSSAFLLPEYVGEEAETLDIDEEDRDVLFEDAASIVVMHQQGSASLLQRKLKLGYNRAGRLIDQLEAAGIVGPFKGSKAREVMIADELALQDYLNKDKA